MEPCRRPSTDRRTRMDAAGALCCVESIDWEGMMLAFAGAMSEDGRRMAAAAMARGDGCGEEVESLRRL